MQQTVMSGGQRYHYYTERHSRESAEKEAAHLRSKGFKVVIKAEGQWYGVYTRSTPLSRKFVD